MLEVPKRTAAANDGNAREIVFGRWRGCGPLERPGIPGIIAGEFAFEHGVEEVANENENGHRLEEDANGDDEIPDVPASAGFVGVDAAGHAKNAGDVHEIEGEMKAEEEEPEVEFSEPFVVKVTAHFGKPIVKSTKEGEEDAANDDVVEMSDDKVGVPKLPVEGSGGEHDAGESGDQELKEETDAEEHGGFELQFAAPHGAEPIEDFDSGGNADDHSGDHEKTVGVGIHTDGEHVVSPHAKADKADADGGSDHHGIAENGLARENRKDF